MNQYLSTFTSTFDEADQQAICITSHLKTYYGNRLTTDIEFNLNFVMREMFNNAVEHGNQMQSGKKVSCRVLYDDEAIIIEVTDEGQGYNKTHEPPTEPTSDSNSIPVRRRGLWLIEQLGFKVTCRKKTIVATYYWRVKNDREESK